MSGGIQAEKELLRARVGALRRGFDAGWVREASARLQAQVMGLPEFLAARQVACYLALPGEVQAESIVQRCRTDGKALCLPAFDCAKRVYGFVNWPADAVMVRGPMGIAQPADLQAAEGEAIDFVVVPGVAFDTTGGRLGHGGGHFDRMLSGAVRAFKVGVAFEAQLAERVPMGPHDVRMDAVVTESRVLRG